MTRVDFGGCEIELSGRAEIARGGNSQSINDGESMLEAIRTDGDPLCNARDGVRTVSICNALDEAARTGKPQTVPN